MGEKMSNAPIFFIAGQVRFNPILQMADSVKSLQQHFRRSGFADYSQDEVKSIQVVNVGPAPQINIVPVTRWRFGNSKRDAEYVLFPERFVFQTTFYETSAGFMESVIGGLQAIHNEVQLNYIDAVSIRTLDAVILQEKESLDDYLHPQLLGFYGLSAGDLKHSILESVRSLNETTQLISRVAILRGPLGLPPDLMPMLLALDPRFDRPHGAHAILDNDCAEQERFDFDIAGVRTRLSRVKSGVTEAFYSAVTATALNRWR